MAREVQLAMLPQTHVPVIVGELVLKIAHRFHPAGGVSGDFFDVLRLSEETVGLLVCDVMGHGVRSALITAMVRVMVEELKPIASDPGLFLTRLNRDLTAILRQTRSLIFVTAAYVMLDPRAGRIRYSQAGHPTPLRWNEQSGIIRPVSCSEESAGPALGLMGDFEFTMTEDVITPGDRVALYTDGITEAPTADGTEFGTTRLGDVLVRQGNQLLDAALTARWSNSRHSVAPNHFRTTSVSSPRHCSRRKWHQPTVKWCERPQFHINQSRLMRQRGWIHAYYLAQIPLTARFQNPP